MNLVQVNSVYNTGSTGRIVEGIANAARERGHQTLAVYGRKSQPGATDSYRVAGLGDQLQHGLYSLTMDAHGLGSKRATESLVRHLCREEPDAILLHNLHGYYVNYPILFDFLSELEIPVFWTWHDCWPITGHCAHFIRFGCDKWKATCHQCPMTGYYPRSLIDRSTTNHFQKKKCFTKVPNLTVICPSDWIRRVGRESFLSNAKFSVIHNGVDLSIFRPGKSASQPIVLGVANQWNQAKGLSDFIRLRQLLPKTIRVLLVGVSAKQARHLPSGIEAQLRTDSLYELSKIYSSAAVFCNPTYVDTFPTTNLEALASGLPVITYRSGGSAEAISQNTGDVVEVGDVEGMASKVMEWLSVPRKGLAALCRSRAERMFDQKIQYRRYVEMIEAAL